MTSGSAVRTAGNIAHQKRPLIACIFIGTVACIVGLTTLRQGASTLGLGQLSPSNNNPAWQEPNRKKSTAAVAVDLRQTADKAEDFPLASEAEDSPPAARAEDNLPADRVDDHISRGEAAGDIPHYQSPKARLKRIAEIFQSRGLGSENVCAAFKNGEIITNGPKRQGGKKYALLGKWNEKKVVVKHNELKQIKLTRKLFLAFDKNNNDKVERPEFFQSFRDSLERMGITARVLDRVYHSKDKNRDGFLNQAEALEAAAAVIKRYDSKLPPEALILGENPDLKIFPRYYGHCNSTYLVEFLPVHSMHPYLRADFPIRAKLAAGMLQWAETALEEGILGCDMILGNFALGTDGIVKSNDLDQIHYQKGVDRWKDLPCTPGSRVGCFDDGHCRMKCTDEGKCPIMPPHHNFKEICGRLFLKKHFLDSVPERIARRISLLIVSCAQSTPTRALRSARRLFKLLQEESSSVGTIEATSFAGHKRKLKQV